MNNTRGGVLETAGVDIRARLSKPKLDSHVIAQEGGGVSGAIDLFHGPRRHCIS
jgi:hypothetical protein